METPEPTKATDTSQASANDNAATDFKPHNIDHAHYVLQALNVDSEMRYSIINVEVHILTL